MCIFSTPRLPRIAPPPPPTLSNEAVLRAAQDQARRNAGAAMASQTILTSPQGVTNPAPTATKTLLGG